MDTVYFCEKGFSAPLFNTAMEETLIKVSDWIEKQEIDVNLKNSVIRFIAEAIKINQHKRKTMDFNKVQYIRTDEAYLNIDKDIKISVIEMITEYPLFTDEVQRSMLSMMRKVQAMMNSENYIYYNFIYHFLLEFYRTGILKNLSLKNKKSIRQWRIGRKND